MTHSAATGSTVRRLAIEVRGVVQGVGFRPFVYNTARKRGLAGWVQNAADTVRMEVQGESAALEAFCDALRNAHPPQARIDSLEVAETECRRDEPGAFEIRTSAGQGTPRPTIPADLATCDECLAEIGRVSERRYRYPFTNCTNCGPRWSIIEALPYDRPRTSMAAFPMCPNCQAEYDDPNVIKDDPYSTSTPEQRTKLKLDLHLWIRHPEWAQANGVPPLPAAFRDMVEQGATGKGT